jgi:hypothetical protein
MILNVYRHGVQSWKVQAMEQCSLRQALWCRRVDTVLSFVNAFGSI